MTSWGFVNHFVFFGLLIIVSVGTNQGEDVCSLSGGFCGSVGCSPVNNNETFKCDCGGSHYFNATSKRCLHRASCQVVPCQHSICIDDDGHSEATCTCDGVPHMASDCRVDAAFHNQCAANGGTVVMASEDGRSVPKCGCPIGTKHLTNGTCESIACLLPNLTCEEICRDVKLREDMRCCQNWTKDRCDESPQPGTFCEPGTIWNEANKTCTNACAATVSGPVCEHGCTYADPMAPAYQCKCGEDQQLSPDGLYCELKSECSGSEVDICSREGRVCFFENRKVLCKCPLEGAHFCSDMSSSGKKHDGVSFLSSCTVKGNTEVCTCHPPLRWDAESKLCVLAEEYRYAVFFERKDFQGHSVAWEQCSDRTQNEIINSAMKNLYGLQLQGARIVNCSSKVTKIELTFTEDPSSAVLQRIRLCEIGSQTCSFPPSLLIQKGSVSGPVAIDLCHTYFEKLGAVSNGTYRCSNLSHGRYLIHCSSGKENKEIHSGFLELRLCSATYIEKKGATETWNYKLTLVYCAISVVFLFFVFAFVLGCHRLCERCDSYRFPGNTKYSSVTLRGIENLAEEGDL